MYSILHQQGLFSFSFSHRAPVLYDAHMHSKFAVETLCSPCYSYTSKLFVDPFFSFSEFGLCVSLTR